MDWSAETETYSLSVNNDQHGGRHLDTHDHDQQHSVLKHNTHNASGFHSTDRWKHDASLKKLVK